MKYLMTLTLIVMSLIVLAGGPKIKKIEASSESVKPGQSSTVTVTLKGKSSGVTSMELIVREFPYDVPPYVLKPISGSKNKVWTAVMPVPYEAPQGTYHLELNVKLEDGSTLTSDGSDGNEHGKAGTVIVTVG